MPSYWCSPYFLSSRCMDRIQAFSPATIERLGYYVYALIKPDDQEIFYIGKGQGNRVFAHEMAAEAQAPHTTEADEADELEDKLALLAQYRGRVVRRIIMSGLTEREALLVEAALIAVLKDRLTNRVAGHYEEFDTVEEVELQTGTTPLGPVAHKVIFIKINRQWDDILAGRCTLYDATRMWWKLNIAKARQYNYAAAVAHGIVRELYEIDHSGWQQHPEWKRWALKGTPVQDATLRQTYVGKSIGHLMKPGAQNPIKYAD